MGNRYGCDMIQDLLALYHDGVCSEESRAAVEQHLGECEKCSEIAKQLADSEIEDNISQQAQDVLKNHDRKQRRKIHIIIACAAAAVLAVVLIWVVKPRVEIGILLRSVFPEVGDGSGYFTEYDVTDNSLAEVQFEGYSVGIPAGFQKEETEYDSFEVYRDTENRDLSVVMIYPESLDMNLYKRDSFGENISDEEYERIVSECSKWFDALGNGQPDSAYGVFKCCYMLSDDDLSFWNIGQNIAFGITAFLREEVISAIGDEAYIYETDDKCGIIRVDNLDQKKPYYYFVVDMFKTDNLDYPHALLIRTDSLEQGYAIINSINFD